MSTTELPTYTCAYCGCLTRQRPYVDLDPEDLHERFWPAYCMGDACLDALEPKPLTEASDLERAQVDSTIKPVCYYPSADLIKRLGRRH